MPDGADLSERRGWREAFFDVDLFGQLSADSEVVNDWLAVDYIRLSAL